MSRTIIFIALQCCECFTMQVKQQKKSSNKWTCVVCNQKQSVRKVFAQGPMAKDLRKFVQSFNMSRKHADENPPPLAESGYVIDLDDDAENEKKSVNQSKRRTTDWTDYLDLDDQHHNELVDEMEPKIVTEEITKEMFKKPKLKDSYVPGKSKNFAYKPIFTERNARSQDDEEEMRSEVESNQLVVGDSKRTVYNVKKEESRNHIVQMARASSKWDQYVIQDAEDLQLGSRILYADRESGGGNELLQTDWDDFTVEDEVHPDFM